MPRTNDAPASRRRRKKYIKLAKGYRGSRHRMLKTAKQAVDHAGQYAYRDRRNRKRDFRRLWIARISAATRAGGINYSQFIRGLKLAEVDVNRKVLADIAVSDLSHFNQLVDIAKAKLEASA